MNRKKIIIIIITILILLMISLITFIGYTHEKYKREAGNYVEILDNGTKVNTSSKLLETKKIDGLELTNLKLTENNNMTKLSGTITNTSKKEKGEYVINVELFDSKGKKMTTMGVYIKKLQPGESMQLNSSTTLDYSNAYSIKLIKGK